MSIRIHALLLLGFLLAGVSPAMAGSLTEDFTTTTYRDGVATTADWNTGAGQLSLFPFAPTLASYTPTPGESRAIFIHGDLALVCDELGSGGLLIVDISDPANPDSLTYVQAGVDVAFDAVARGNLAYLADRSGLQIYDISDPSNPTLVRDVNTPGTARDIAISGNIAVIADGAQGLQVIDITDPAAAVVIGSLAGVNTNGVDISENIVCLADATELTIIDVTDPANPDSIGAFPLAAGGFDVTIAGTHAFVSAATDGFYIIDISSPSSPTLVSTFNPGGQALDIEVSGDRAYVANYSNGLRVFDISDLATPTLIGTYNTGGRSYGVDVSGNHAFTADRQATGGLYAIRVNHSNPPVIAGSAGSFGLGTAVSGNTAVLATGNDLEFIDITDPANPGVVDIQTPNALGVSIVGGFAFASCDAEGVNIYNMTDPANTVLTGSFNTAGSAQETVVDGDYAYVADFANGLVVLDVSDYSVPAKAGSLMTTGPATGLALAGDILYVSCGFGGIDVVDVSDPTNPTYLNNGATLASGIVVDGQLLFTTGSTSYGLKIFDISNAGAPALLSTFGGFNPGGEGRQSVAVDFPYAYLTHSTEGVKVLDISDPANPLLVATVATPGIPGSNSSARSIVIDGQHVFLADGAGGLQVIRVYQDEADTENNVGQSLAVDAGADTVRYARLRATQIDSVAWEVSADGGANWEAIMAGSSSWLPLANPGTDLLWRSTMQWTGMTPVVSDLTLEWLYDHGALSAITDVPEDQGGRVYVEIDRSALDFASEPAFPVTQYGVYRRVDNAALTTGIEAPAADANDLEPAVPTGVNAEWVNGVLTIQGTGRSIDRPAFDSLGKGPQAATFQSFPPGTWALVATVPATQSDTYLAEVTTAADSSGTGTNHAVFLVTTHTTTPSVWYASDPDSGYSVDNIAPGVPAAFAAAFDAGDVVLSWDPAPEEDFQYYRVYRDTDPGFVPGPGNLVHETATNGWTDTPSDPGNAYYKVTALDYAGNESEPAMSGAVTSVGDRGVAPAAFALRPAAPNPFRAGAAGTRISFDLPEAASVRLEVFDITGRLVQTVAHETMAAGEHGVVWDGANTRGERVSAGVYLYRLSAGAFQATRRVVLIQ